MSELSTDAGTRTCPSCAEEIDADARFCRYCGQAFTVRRVGYCTTCHRQVAVAGDRRCPTCGAEVIDITFESIPAPGATVAQPVPAPAAQPVPVVPSMPPAGAPTVAPAARGRIPLGMRIVVALALAVVVIVAVVVIRAIVVGEASSPSDLADRFPEAGVTCLDFDVIFDNRESKALGCSAEAGQIITITTYADRPSDGAWRRMRCDASTAGLEQGTYVLGDGFVIDILQGPYPADLVTPTPIETVAANLAGVLGGTAGAYDCSAAG